MNCFTSLNQVKRFYSLTGQHEHEHEVAPLWDEGKGVPAWEKLAFSKGAGLKA